MACGCQSRNQKTEAQLRREAKRAERQAQREAQKQEATDAKVPAPSNG